MHYRTLGPSDLSVSAITFGAWAIGGWMWGGSDRREAVEAIRASVDAGVTSIDTAPIYGFGLSEEIVAEALQGIARDKVQILTKFGLRWEGDQGEFYFTSEFADGKEARIYKFSGKDSVIHEVEASLRRLKTDYIDLYQIHWPDSTTAISETFEAVARLKEQGKIREAGVCNYSVSQMREAEAACALVSNQVPYSMIQRAIEEELVPHCVAHNRSILAYSPLQRGLLTGKITPETTFAPGDHRPTSRHFQPENIRRTQVLLDALRPLAADKGCTLGQLVIAWTIEQPAITVALVGARNAQQALENAAAAQVKLSLEELAFIREQVDKTILL